ncbi:hypothetical protein ES703_37678 [subsurface metagenome]
MVEKVGHECDVCGKILSTRSGLVGHKMFAHPEPVERPSGSPEEVLVELLGCVKEALDRMDGRVKDWGSQLVGLEAKIADASGRLDSFQGGFMERLQVAQAAQQAAEDRAAHAEAEARKHPKPERDLLEVWLNCDACVPLLRDFSTQLGHELMELGEPALAKHVEEFKAKQAEAEAAVEAAAKLPPQRWLIVRPGYSGGFKWKYRWDSFPGVSDSIKCEGYCKVIEDEADLEKFRGERGVEVIGLNPDGEPRPAWLIMSPAGGHRSFRWDQERGKYCLLVWDEEVAGEWAKKGGFEVVELAGTVLEEYEKAHPLGE